MLSAVYILMLRRVGIEKDLLHLCHPNRTLRRALWVDTHKVGPRDYSSLEYETERVAYKGLT